MTFIKKKPIFLHKTFANTIKDCIFAKRKPLLSNHIIKIKSFMKELVAKINLKDTSWICWRIYIIHDSLKKSMSKLLNLLKTQLFRLTKATRLQAHAHAKLLWTWKNLWKSSAKSLSLRRSKNKHFLSKKKIRKWASNSFTSFFHVCVHSGYDDFHVCRHSNFSVSIHYKYIRPLFNDKNHISFE